MDEERWEADPTPSLKTDSSTAIVICWSFSRTRAPSSSTSWKVNVTRWPNLTYRALSAMSSVTRSRSAPLVTPIRREDPRPESRSSSYSSPTRPDQAHTVAVSSGAKTTSRSPDSSVMSSPYTISQGTDP